MTDEEISKNLYLQLFPLLKGNTEATVFCVDLMNICQVWDDLIDRDVKYTDNDINRTFQTLLFSLPMNEFYVKYQNELRPLIMNSILKWFDANKMEQGKEESDLNMAYMLRAEIYSIFCYVAFLVGGINHAKEVGIEIRRIYGEKLPEFIEEMQNA
jgi:hypothetical protein